MDILLAEAENFIPTIVDHSTEVQDSGDAAHTYTHTHAHIHANATKTSSQHSLIKIRTLGT